MAKTSKSSMSTNRSILNCLFITSITLCTLLTFSIHTPYDSTTSTTISSHFAERNSESSSAAIKGNMETLPTPVRIMKTQSQIQFAIGFQSFHHNHHFQHIDDSIGDKMNPSTTAATTTYSATTTTNNNKFCPSQSKEPIFWSQTSYAIDPPTESEVNDFLLFEFGHCCCTGTNDDSPSDTLSAYATKSTTTTTTSTPILFFSSSCAVTQPWIAKALQLHFPKIELVIYISDPVDRAFSEMIHHWDWIKEAPSLKKKYEQQKSNDDGNVDNVDTSNNWNGTFTPELYHELVVLELTITQICGIPIGKGYLKDDWETVVDFHSCCRGISKHLNHEDWPGCDAYGMRNIINDDEPPQVLGKSAQHFHPIFGLGRDLTPYGGTSFLIVRQGVYMDFLSTWVEQFGKDEIKEVVRIVPIEGLEELEKDWFVPWNKTVALLQIFYGPMNDALNQLFEMELLDDYGVLK